MSTGRPKVGVRSVSVALLLLLMSSPALAGGMEMPDNGTRALARGGAFTVLADDLSAIAHNPGALIRLQGTQLLFSNHVYLVDERFTRGPSLFPEDPNTQGYGHDPFAPVSNSETVFPLGPVFAVGSDFGEDNLFAAFGIYAPNGTGKKKWPLDGGQRYMLTELESLLFYVNGSLAYGEKDSYGVGLSLQVAMAPSMRMNMVTDGSPFGVLNPYASVNDVEAVLEVSDLFALSAIFGAWWRPIPEIELGLSGRIVPVSLDASGDFELRNIPGQTQFTPERLEVTGSSARLRLKLPPTLRAGVRYRHLCGGEELWDVEVNVVYEAWSIMQSMDVEMEGQINLFAIAEAPNANIARRWRDTLSTRIGSTFHLGELATVSAGAYYETGAVPENYEHIDFMSFDRIGLSLGFGLELGPVRLSGAYMHVFQEPRSVSEATAKGFQIRPLDPCPDACDFGAGWSGVPANTGVFESGYDIFSASIETTF